MKINEMMESKPYRALLMALAASLPTYGISTIKKRKRPLNDAMLAGLLSGTAGYFANDLEELLNKGYDTIRGK